MFCDSVQNTSVALLWTAVHGLKTAALEYMLKLKTPWEWVVLSTWSVDVATVFYAVHLYLVKNVNYWMLHNDVWVTVPTR